MAETLIDVRDLPLRLPQLLAAARTGAEIVVTIDNLPQARLIPLPENKPRVLGLNIGTVQMSDDFDSPLPEEYWTGTP